MGQLDNLGKARNANQLAKELDIPKSTIYNNPKAFGGIRIGGRKIRFTPPTRLEIIELFSQKFTQFSYRG
jgi:hypothetical protein